MNVEIKEMAPQTIAQAVIDKAKMSLRKHIREHVAAAGLYGSRLRGYSDIAADSDIVFLIRKRNSDYLCVANRSQEFNDRIGFEERQQMEFSRINRAVSEEVGIRIAVTLIDERKLIMGIMQCNPINIGAVQSLAKNSKYVRAHLLPLVDKYFNFAVASSRYMEVAHQQMHRLNTADNAQVFRQERNYLTALWCILRSLEFIVEKQEDEQPKPLMQMIDLITNAIACHSHACPALEEEDLFAPFWRRVERDHLDEPVLISVREQELLQDLYRQASLLLSRPSFTNGMDKADHDAIAKELLAMLQRNEAYYDTQDND